MNYSNLSIGELLISEDYITIPTPLAIALGLPRSVILKSIYAWCRSNRTQGKKEYFKDGCWWTRGTYELWQKQMPYIGCAGTVKRLILSLEKDGLIVSDFLHAKRSDREKWYRVDLEVLEKFCNVKLVEFAKTMGTECDDDENTDSDRVTKSDDHENKIRRSNGTECDDDLYLNQLRKQPDLNDLINTPLTPKGEEVGGELTEVQTSLFSEEPQEQKSNSCQNSKSGNSEKKVNPGIKTTPHSPPSKPPKLTAEEKAAEKKEKTRIADLDFERFWAIVDYKQTRDLARRRFIALVVSGISADVLIQKREEQQGWHEANRGSTKYLKRPATWLGTEARGWEDEMEPTAIAASPSSGITLTSSALVKSQPSEGALRFWNKYLAIVAELGGSSGSKELALEAYERVVTNESSDEQIYAALEAFLGQEREKKRKSKDGRVFLPTAENFIVNDGWKLAIGREVLPIPTPLDQEKIAMNARLKAKHGDDA